MKASEANLLKFIQTSTQFCIPIYQRTYSWTLPDCEQLWNDIVRCGSDDSIQAHFIGSIVYIQHGIYHVSKNAPLLVIDGQQRLTTVTILINSLVKALERLPEDQQEPIEDFTPTKLRHYHLINHLESGDKFYKLILSQTDKETLKSLVKGSPEPNEKSIRVSQTAEFFDSKLADPRIDLVTICKGLSKLLIVDISLTHGQDNPQLIFESMNSTGRELTQADLIRNFILMGQEFSIQTALYEHYWRPMEQEFGQVHYATMFDSFMRHYLTVKTGTIPNIDEVYDAFKAYARRSDVASLGIEALVKDIRAFSRYFCSMALGKESNPELRAAFHDLRELVVDVSYPFLLELYNDYANNKLSQQDFHKILRLVESYIFRRTICSIPTNSHNKTFSTFSRNVDETRYFDSVQAHFLNLPTYRRFPDDDEFVQNFQIRDLYNFRNRAYWLRKFENHNRNERVFTEEYTIEHIMPQNENLSDAWRNDLGPEWQKVQKTWLHTLGNLTLTGYNSTYSDHSFQYKRDHANGFKHSPLRINEGLGQVEVWNEEAIKDRAQRLAKFSLKVWTAPALSPEYVASQQPAVKDDTYSIEIHTHLQNSQNKDLFEAFRRQVLSLDPCVTEEVLKLYVAYKAETNFVDVVPQAKRLRLSLNMPFADINDPKGICKDVTDLGRWGNGDVEVGLDKLEDLPYIMGLVKQAFERQIGN